MLKPTKLFVLILLCLPLVAAGLSTTTSSGASGKESLAIVTYVGNHLQERSARALVKSIRKFGGEYRSAPVYIVLGDEANFPCTAMKGGNIILMPLEMDPDFKDYPLAFKAFAAAQVEKAVKDKVSTLAWFDPATLVVGSLEELDLASPYGAAVRPVSLVNTIGMPPGDEPNDYWSPVYSELGLNYKDLPAYETVVDEKPIQPYFNCEIFSVDPRLGILGDWAHKLTRFLKDETYQDTACTTFLRRLFLHQAVLSAVIMARIDPGKIKPLSLKAGYPFAQHGRLSDRKKTESLNGLSAVIFDYRWDRDPKWMERIPVTGVLKKWLFNTFIEYLKLTDHLYRIEGSCNSYLITTNEGSVLIDPAGAAAAPQYFKHIIADHPLQAILLTHAHRDHWDHMEVWRTDTKIPIIAQRNFIKYNEYWKRLSPFFARRGAIWGRKPLPDPAKTEPFNPVVPTVTFVDEYTHELGGFHFKMIHTSGETPDQTFIWIPELDAAFVGDNYYAWFINNATLRGTLPRPISGYIRTQDLALSCQPRFLLPGHGAPVASKAVVRETAANFRDALVYIRDETIKGINQGKDVHTLMREIKVPDRYKIRPYYGTIPWTIRGIYHEYIGWFDENPVSMYDLPASSIHTDLVAVAGAEAIIGRAEKHLNNKEHVKVLHLTDVVLNADPRHIGANETRLKALRALKAGTYNYIERIWLDYGIRVSEENINKSKK